MKSKLFAGLLFLLAARPPPDLSAVSLVADNWCPQHCEANGRRKGYVVEIVEQALAAEGVVVNIVYRPWTRALRQTESGAFALQAAGRFARQAGGVPEGLGANRSPAARMS